MQWVIKIGGSLYSSKYLVEWLQALSCSSRNIIIVPGGGPFADQVRAADQQYKLDHVLSHKMAILGMQQFGYLMASLCPKLSLANSKEQILSCWEQNKVVIWEPYNMVNQYCKIEQSWEVTSDSLAAWLAKFLSVEHLLFVKSAEITLSNATVDELTALNCIDSTLSKLLAKMDTSVHFMHKSQVDKVNQKLSTD